MICIVCIVQHVCVLCCVLFLKKQPELRNFVFDLPYRKNNALRGQSVLSELILFLKRKLQFQNLVTFCYKMKLQNMTNAMQTCRCSPPSIHELETRGKCEYRRSEDSSDAACRWIRRPHIDRSDAVQYYKLPRQILWTTPSRCNKDRYNCNITALAQISFIYPINVLY